MTIDTADKWLSVARQRLQIIKTGALVGASAPGLLASTFALNGNPGAGTLAAGNTTSGVLFSGAISAPSAGVPPIVAFGSGNRGYLSALNFRNSITGAARLYDRIWAAGAIPQTTGTTTFSGQPSISSRVPSGTNYSGTEILIEFVTPVSVGNGTITVGYTNQSGVSGRTTTGFVVAGSNIATTIAEMTLQSGDIGVQKVDSVTVSGATGTFTFNVVIARRLADFTSCIANAKELLSWDQTEAPEVFQDSAFWLVVKIEPTTTGFPTLGLTILNG